jgi:hypothetical protein
MSRDLLRSDVLTFRTSGASFAAILTVKRHATIRWTFHDGAVSTSARLARRFGRPADRFVRLKVTPWSALKGINIGYDGGDDGPSTIEMLDGQNVVSVFGLHNAAPFLRSWSSSNNPIRALDFRNFIKLEVMECFQCRALASIRLTNTPKLARLNIEGGSVAALDLSESPQLEDLRASLNPYATITWGRTGSRLWHYCARDATKVTANFPDMKQFPRLKQLWIWNSGQTGALSVASSQLASVIVSDNRYTSIDLHGQFPAGRDAYVEANNNALTRLDISDDPGLSKLHARDNALNRAAVDAILQQLDDYGAWNGELDLRGNESPSAAGMAHVESLKRRGWKVKAAQPGAGPP